MPIFEYECFWCGHVIEHYFKRAEKRKKTLTCESCGKRMKLIVSKVGSALWAEEGRPRTIYNLSHEPQTFTSRRAHQKAVREAGCVEAGSRRGEKGVWI